VGSGSGPGQRMGVSRLSGLPWFRMYSEAVDDEKLRLLAFEDRWHFVALLCLKAQGILDERNADLRTRKICVKLGLDSVELETVMKRLVTVGLVTSTGQPLAWAKRQFQSDSSTSRVRAFRERQRNVSVTPPDTDTDTDTDTEAEKNKTRAPAREPPPAGMDANAWNRWETYRREIRKPIKPASVQAAQRKLAGFGADQAAVVEQSIAQGWTGLFDLKDVRGKPKLTWRPPPDEAA